MKKLIVILILVFLFVLFGATGIFARQGTHSIPGSFINIYKIDSNVAAGLKHRFHRNLYATTNIEYRSPINDLQFQVGAVYLLPQKILFFRLYGGTGLQVSRNEGFQYPYVVLGTHFLVFFSEVVHPWTSRTDAKFRGGFSFKF